MDGGRVGDLRIMKIKNWKQKAINREAWNKLVEKAKTHTELWRYWKKMITFS
jgi:hypothetical protein